MLWKKEKEGEGWKEEEEERRRRDCHRRKLKMSSYLTLCGLFKLISLKL